MKNLCLFILVSLGCMLPSSTYAQPFTLEAMSHNDLLPSYSVQQIFQDKEGFIWFGTTDGLSRYDGYRLLTFRSDLNNRMLLSNNNITFITEDARNRLFIGTQKGLCYLDKTTYEITNMKETVVATANIRFITCTTNGDIWVAADDKLIKFNSDLTQFTDYKTKFPQKVFNSIFEDKKGTIWLLLWNNGLYRYDAPNDSFIPYPPIGKANNPFTIIQDNQERYWIGTWGSGLYLFDPQAKGEEIYTPIPCNDQTNKNPENIFFGLVQDDSFGSIWAVSLSGLYVFDTTSKQPSLNKDIPLKNEANNVFSGISKDKEGNIWVGSFNEGAYQIRLNQPSVKNYPLPSIRQQSGFTPNINMLFKDNSGDLWFNQINWGMGIYSFKEDKIRYHKNIPGLEEIKSIHCIKSWKEHPDEIWIGPESYNVIYQLHKKGNQLHVKNKINLSDIKKNTGIAHLLFEDSRCNKWIVTISTLIIQYAHQNQFRPIDYDFGTVSGITEDLKGSIWISSNKGIYRVILDPNAKSNAPEITRMDNDKQLYSENMTAIGMGTSDDLWIGTQEGFIFRYNILEDTYTDMSSQIRIMGEHIQDIIPDDWGHLWFVTNKRIMEYSPSNGACREYSTKDGVLVNSFRRNSWIKDNEGKIYIGGNRGISIFTPSANLHGMPQTQRTVITEVMVNNQSIYGKDGARFDINKQKLILQPHEKNIELHFSALRYSNPHNIRFAYKMEGIDKDWIMPDENRQFAVYNQLTKGNHTFLIKASDENRLWNEHITKFTIYKYPDWYESNLAHTIYFILSLMLSYTVYYFVRNKVQLQNSLRIAQIEKEKSEELTQIKLSYYTHVSHDLLTPLTIMSCLMDDIQIAYPDKAERFSTMRFNLNHLKKLLQQVLDFRKIESGKMNLLLSEGDIVAFIKESCYTYFIPLMQKKKIQFSILTNPDKINCYFDTDKIEKIIFNLLSNSYKYTEREGKVELSIRTDSDSWVIIQVSDTGVGISKKEQQLIFTPFYSNQWKDNRDTNGIGLSVVKQMIELHHGTIEIDSEVNEGTTFTIRIPLQKEKYSEPEVNNIHMLPPTDLPIPIPLPQEWPLQREMKATASVSNTSPSLLLVEDNEELLELMESILEKEYNITVARNGTEALQLVNTAGKPIELIVSDVMMPEMNGLEFCQAIKNKMETSHIPIILLTARSTPEDRIECYKAGANGYISKPFELNVLKARIDNFLAEKSSKQTKFLTDKQINISTLSYPSIDEQFLERVVAVIENYLSEKVLDIESISHELNLSKATFYRKIKAMTGLTPLEFIRNIQLKHACSMLNDPSINVSEVAYSVGFTDPKYFTKCFKGAFNMTPSEYQKSQSLRS